MNNKDFSKLVTEFFDLGFVPECSKFHLKYSTDDCAKLPRADSQSILAHLQNSTHIQKKLTSEVITLLNLILVLQTTSSISDVPSVC